MKWKKKVVFFIVVVAIALALSNVYNHFFESSYIVTALFSIISFSIAYWLIIYENKAL